MSVYDGLTQQRRWYLRLFINYLSLYNHGEFQQYAAKVAFQRGVCLRAGIPASLLDSIR